MLDATSFGSRELRERSYIREREHACHEELRVLPELLPLYIFERQRMYVYGSRRVDRIRYARLQQRTRELRKQSLHVDMRGWELDLFAVLDVFVDHDFIDRDIVGY